MTLNMTVLTRNAIYQSADFRLTSHPAGSPVEDTSAKIVTLQYSSWLGFVTYTGMGEWDGKAISDWIVEWLADGAERSMSDTAAILEDKMTKKIRAERRRTLQPNRKHTFTLAGFEDGVVRAFVISNFEDCYGNTRPVSYALSTTRRHIRGRSRAAALVTGAPKAVPVQERRILAKLASNHPDDGGRIRRRMKWMNAEAAASPASQGLVSTDCVVISFRSDGYGNLMFSDADGQRPANIPQITHGLDINAWAADAMKAAGFDLSNAKVVSASWASSKSPGPSGVVQSTCTFPVVNTDTDDAYQIVEIAAPQAESGAALDIETGVAADINDDGHIVGYGRERQNPFTTNVPWIVRGNPLERLNVNGWAMSINRSDQAAMVVFDGTHGTQTGIYTDDSIRIFPLRDANGKLGSSHAAAINALGIIAGSVTPYTDVLGVDTTGAAIFSLEYGRLTFDEFVGQYRTASMDINDSGQVLVEITVGPYSTRALLWQPADGSWHIVGDRDTDVRPVALTNDGVVLGNSRNPAEVVVCPPGGAWTSLGTDMNWTANDINDSGDVVGIMMQDDLFRPWLRLATGQIVMLPHIAGHHTSANAINAAGQVVGGAQADHGGHAVIWQRK